LSAPPYMKLYIADYHGDTTHLDCREHGAYLLLLMAMWRAGGKLPLDDAKLAKLAKLSRDEWDEIRETVLAFFKRRGAVLTHKRLAAELEHYGDVVEKRKTAAKARGQKKTNESSELASANAGAFDQHLTAKPEPEPEPEPVVIEEPSSSEARARLWMARLEEAKAEAGDMADLTRPAMHHAADLRALVEPVSGEPCTWDEVLVAIAMTAMRQRPKRKLIGSWSWVRDDALALRDKRLNAANPDVAEVIPLRGAPATPITDRLAAEHAEARRKAFELMDARHGQSN
jgi:uncharacterized protein YdaU (DUF1376 family)